MKHPGHLDREFFCRGSRWEEGLKSREEKVKVYAGVGSVVPKDTVPRRAPASPGHAEDPREESGGELFLLPCVTLSHRQDLSSSRQEG